MVCPANISSPVGSCHIFLKRYGDASTNTQLSSAHLPQTLGLVNNLLTALINYVTHTHRLDAIKGEVVDCSCLCCMTRSVEQQLCGGREVAGAHPYSLKPHTWKPSSHPCLTGPRWAWRSRHRLHYVSHLCFINRDRVSSGLCFTVG